MACTGLYDIWLLYKEITFFATNKNISWVFLYVLLHIKQKLIVVHRVLKIHRINPCLTSKYNHVSIDTKFGPSTYSSPCVMLIFWPLYELWHGLFQDRSSECASRRGYKERGVILGCGLEHYQDQYLYQHRFHAISTALPFKQYHNVFKKQNHIQTILMRI